MTDDVTPGQLRKWSTELERKQRTTVTVTVTLPVDEAEAAAADEYPQVSSIFSTTRARARFGAACSVALAMHRVEEAHAAYAKSQGGGA